MALLCCSPYFRFFLKASCYQYVATAIIVANDISKPSHFNMWKHMHACLSIYVCACACTHVRVFVRVCSALTCVWRNACFEDGDKKKITKMNALYKVIVLYGSCILKWRTKSARQWKQEKFCKFPRTNDHQCVKPMRRPTPQPAPKKDEKVREGWGIH